MQNSIPRKRPRNSQPRSVVSTFLGFFNKMYRILTGVRSQTSHRDTEYISEHILLFIMFCRLILHSLHLEGVQTMYFKLFWPQTSCIILPDTPEIIFELTEFLFHIFQHHNFQTEVRIPASTLVPRS